MLADRLPYANVVGVDVDPEAVALGMQYASSDNCSFFVGDLATWCVQVEGRVEPLPQFDLVVCFDTIEHTTHRDLAWQRLRSGVTAGGAVLLSTPVRPEETDLNPPWHAHSVEYGHVDLMGIATTHFREVLMPLDSDFPYREFWDQVNHGRMRYWNVANPLVMSH
jgi:2-polyprenyl-3-methyl-5-hydroxy-6-metoxy-1,4-benzoquinol methylase